MAHMGTGEIGLQSYMPEVERAPWSPDSGAPVSQQVPSREVLCPQGCAESQQCCLFVQVLPGCIQGTAGLETAVLTWAVAGQGQRRDGKGWETFKDILHFLLKVRG